ALLAIIAVTPRITLWGLIELKAEILVQASPAFVLGSLWPGLAARGVLCGAILGAIVAGLGTLFGHSLGVVAWLANLTVAVGLSLALAGEG
ncbi:MAG TPA: sodium:solute symporter family protein, partial [Vicinamibacteria bacterium]|nr:sodium:solute symporter family protein [Vicinamibacteria bacterium]